jgi:ferredoxin-NADP reductase
MTIIPVKIAEIRQETPTVRVLRLDLQGQGFKYKAGQWIDCYAEIDGLRQVVGYSLASSPSSEGFIELAVKVSDNPVTVYVHTGAEVGDTLYIEGGQGDVYYEAGMGAKVVLAAAGIGVSPLMGILRYIDEATDATVTLFQSASVFDELIYFDELMRRAERNPRVRYYPCVTREEPPEGVGMGRVSGEVFMEKGVDLGSLFYLSGPGGMIPELRDYLVGQGVDEKRIKYEVWW